jgi:hypothetical protein
MRQHFPLPLLDGDGKGQFNEVQRIIRTSKQGIDLINRFVVRGVVAHARLLPAALRRGDEVRRPSLQFLAEACPRISAGVVARGRAD